MKIKFVQLSNEMSLSLSLCVSLLLVCVFVFDIDKVGGKVEIR